jgi:GntR family transcriptional regulator of arabinose operon
MDNEKHKYEMLKSYIMETIKSEKLEHGQKIYTENELADKLNVSRHTVRKAIGALVNEGWLYRQQGKGTFVGNKIAEKDKKTKIIGVITTYMNDYIFPSIIRGIDSVLSEKGYNIVLLCTYNQHEKERNCLESIQHQDIEGLIVEPTKSALPNPNMDVYNDIVKSGIPLLFINGFNKDIKSSYVIEDDISAGYLATKHLIELGHKSICGIFKIDDIQGHNRFSGFHKDYHFKIQK